MRIGSNRVVGNPVRPTALQRACICILAGINFTSNRNNLIIVAVALGMEMGRIPLIEAGIRPAPITAALLNALLNGASGSVADAKASKIKAYP